MYRKIIPLLFLTGHAFASPTIYPTNTTKISSIKNTTNSNIVADTVDANKFYVMPPSIASATVDGLHTMTANLGFCREMADDQTYSRNLAKKINDLTLEEIESRGQAEVIRKNLATARESFSKFSIQNNLQDLNDLDATLTSIEVRLSDLYTRAEDCQISCESLNQEIKDLVAQKAKLQKDRRAITTAHAKDLREYEHRKALVAAIQSELKDLDEAWQKIYARLLQVKQDFSSMYQTFGKLEGARAKLSFKSDWDHNLSDLRNQNPGFSFEKIQTQNAQIMTNIALPETIPTGAAILNYEVGGVNVSDKLSLSSYPENLSGNVRLSLVGACPVLHPDWFDINLPNGTDQMKYGLTISYEYPTTFSVNAKAEYNMFKMYQKIISSGSSGGFFSSRSWSNVEEKNMFRDSFQITWDEQDPDFTLPETQKEAIESEMRKHIFDRIATLALPQAPDRKGIIQAVGVPQHGSLVLADSLMGTCPGNEYCIGASIALNVLDAIFGSSSSNSSYLQIYDTKSVENFSRSKVVMKPMISVYQ